MAIVIQEERGGQRGWFGFGILFIIVAIIGISAYYLFFVQPELIDSTVAPIKLESIDELKSLQFDPNEVLGSYFQNKQYNVPAPTISQGGNAMPFGVQ